MKRPGLFPMLIVFIVLCALIIKISSGLYVNYAWFKDLGYSSLFTIPIIAKLKIWLISFIIYLLIIFSLGYISYRVFVNAEKESHWFNNKFQLHIFNKDDPQEKNITPVNKSKVLLTLLLTSTVISFFLAFGVTQNGWIKLLEFNNATGFGIHDPIFGKDISFYVFKIPFYNFVLNSLTSFIAVIFLLSAAFFILTGFIKLRGRIFSKNSFHIPHSVRKYWAAMTGVLFILFAIKKYLSMYAVIYSQTGYVYGAGYTDIHVTIPLAKIMAGFAIICGIASMMYFFINDHRLVLGAFSGYVILSLLGTLTHSIVQYNVSNNEFVKEKPYIAEEIKFTRMAYNLDNIKVKDYPGSAEITLESIEKNRSTIENIRLNDPKPLKTVLSQNQGLRYYYLFNDIDIDRYNLDGKYRQVLLSPRELSKDTLIEKAGTFVNLTMRYTHGFGIVATLANEIDESGYAKLIVKDVLQKSTVSGIDIKEPRIYYGELTNDEQYGYVIGNTLAKEFDYPLGDDNVENTYKGTTGIKFTGLNKLFLSAYFNTFRFYLANEITEESKLLMRRNIIDRVSTLMPFLKYDHDPYIVAAKDGKLYWILDAYTVTDKFPYSTPSGDLNYIRNSVKVVIDAYNGTVNFYVFDKKDPVLKTIGRIFPGTFKDASQMPSNLQEHIRYPEDYFNIQANVLLNFHVSNPSVFYNREDTWDIAKKVDENGAKNIEPYYSIMKLPGEKNSEFTLMLPFTPASRKEQHRNNLVAWLAARNDGEHYGQLILYKMPKNVEIQGPLMIDSLIDQDTTISGKLTLWGQGGSQIIRGNLLAVPIDGGFIYVEPIYIKAEKQGASIPQMQAIVFAIDKKIIIVETKSLDKAMKEFFAKEGLKDPGQVKAGEPGMEPGVPKVVNPKQEVLKQIEALKKQLQELEETVRSL